MSNSAEIGVDALARLVLGDPEARHGAGQRLQGADWPRRGNVTTRNHGNARQRPPESSSEPHQRWHAIFRKSERRLYDNLEDPVGTVSLAAERPEVVEALEALLGDLKVREVEAKRLSEALSKGRAS